MIHVDTSFVIDLQRELVRERPAAAFDLIESFDPGEIPGVSVNVVCELRAGADLTRKAVAEHGGVVRRRGARHPKREGFLEDPGSSAAHILRLRE